MVPSIVAPTAVRPASDGVERRGPHGEGRRTQSGHLCVARSPQSVDSRAQFSPFGAY